MSARAGSVLVQVLIMGTMMVILASALLKMIAGHHAATTQVRRNLESRAKAEASLSAVNSVWAETGQVCSKRAAGPDGSSVLCDPEGADCACLCVVQIGDGTIPYPDVNVEKVLVGETGLTRCQTKVYLEID